MKKNSGCLGFIEDFITQLYRDYSNPLSGSLMESKAVFFWWLLLILIGNYPFPNAGTSLAPGKVTNAEPGGLTKTHTGWLHGPS